MHRGATFLFTAFLAASLARPAMAAYPEKPVHLVAPFAAGGATDAVARSLGQRLSKIWGQPVIVDNRPGAGGNLGADLVAKSAPDGYTLLVSSPAEVAINPFLYAKMPFDPAKDLIAVTKVATAPLVLVVNAKSPARSVAELVQYIKSRKGAANYASSGSGGPQHLAGEWFRSMSGTEMTHVPYKGGNPATNDLLGGQVDMFFSGLPPALPHIKAGTLRALAVTTAQRSPLLPGVPTVVESGYPGFAMENWQGVFAPAGTPPAVVAKIAQDIATIAADKEFIAQLSAQGAVPEAMKPAEFASFVGEERLKFARLVKESGAKID